MGEVKPLLVEMSTEVWQRLRARLEGLTDEEYLWSPAPGSWTIGPRPDGTWHDDWTVPGPEPAPFTTLGWRLWHVIDCYGEERAPRWLDVPPQGPPIGQEGTGADGQPPRTAADALALLERAHDRWEAHLALLTEASLAEPIGPVAGPQYASRPRAGYVLHMLDEHIHHGAEIALLRDLWRWQHPLGRDPVDEKLRRGDATVLDDLGAAATADHVALAAVYGRWDLVLALLDAGAPMPATGRTPLHVAAGAGELAIVRILLERGADPTLQDPDFHAVPLVWAEFTRHDDVAAVLRPLT